MFNRQAMEWKPHTYIKIPVLEPREVHLFLPSPGKFAFINKYYNIVRDIIHTYIIERLQRFNNGTVAMPSLI